MNTTSSNQERVDKATRIFIVDDHPLVRESLKCLIQKESDFLICGEAGNRGQALAAIAASHPDLAIVDLTLNDTRGTDFIRDLLNQFPKLLVLVVSMQDELVYAERAIRAGAHGYVTKQEAVAKILTAIRRVLSGDIYWSEKAAAKVASKFTRPLRSHPDQMDFLTDREMQVFEMIGAGQSTRQIGASLHIDTSTVETYRSRIKEKLKLKNGGELLQYAIRWSNDLRV